MYVVSKVLDRERSVHMARMGGRCAGWRGGKGLSRIK